jgi:hypothetical protein
MFAALLVLGLALAVAGVVVFVALCLAIRHEDHSPRLTSRPPTARTAVTRRVAGLSVRRAVPPIERVQPELDAAPWPPPWLSSSDPERR